MPSLSSFALALVIRSACLLAHSGLRFPSSTYFMATSTAVDHFARRTIAIIRPLADHAYAGPRNGPAPGTQQRVTRGRAIGGRAGWWSEAIPSCIRTAGSD